MQEKTIEGYLVKRIKQAGGIAYKWSSPAHRGVPDRLCVLPDKVVAVECKAPGKRPTRLQEHEHRRLRRLGLQVAVVDSKQQVDELIDEIQTP